MKIALVFEDMSQIWGEVLSWTVGADKIVLSLWEGRKQAPKIAFGKFIRVYDRIEYKLIFEGYVSKWDKDTLIIEKYWTFRDSLQATNPRGDKMINNGAGSFWEYSFVVYKTYGEDTYRAYRGKFNDGHINKLYGEGKTDSEAIKDLIDKIDISEAIKDLIYQRRQND